ncbi:enoyl-CoA hydratase/isomerase family protein [Tsuneonella flava]|uniref:Enoyl-CoA hydratase/isomerase family protein n=1 Tax=Tsuneonella flava TaxID=2055955 RepID=A0ABX7KDS8_9SPHN|nr:enoyl-CoA hydratase-related protein [Tsuneonella flava]QSB45371.1 enoyl-CoA hydratase/isomerase family protein [Tsuneonella flava]
MTDHAVIVGVGEFCDRPQTTTEALEPVELMARAVLSASDDGGAHGILKIVDTVDLIGLVSWRYRDPVTDLCQRLGISPQRATNASMGGETPVRLIHDAAIAIEAGRIGAALIVGGEAMSSRRMAKKEGARLDWTPPPSREETVRFPNSSYQTARPARALGMLDPARIYPFYEVATQAEWGETPREGQKRSADLWATYAEVASRNPNAWIDSAAGSEQIGEVSPSNRMICWPYPKLMTANPIVNQAAAVIVMSERKATELGVPADRMIYLHGGASAEESEDYLARDSFSHATAQAAVLDRATQIAGGVEHFDHLELYSCFPVVPKMALRTLGLDPASVSPTVTGGLTFFGGPLNNYMTHATAAMVRRLREDEAGLGLLYGQGGYLTKHHALVLGTARPHAPLSEDYSVQDKAEAARQPVPELLEDYRGPATIETYTAPYARDGKPLQGIVIARTPEGKRLMARVPDTDTHTLDLLTSMERNAIGISGQVRMDTFGKLVFTADENAAEPQRRFTQVERDGHLTIVTINRPDAMNALDAATNAELAEIFDEFDRDPDQWVAIITGAGERAFSAGNDLKETVRLMKRGAPIETPLTGFAGLTARFDLSKPVIAAVNGVAMGGGFEVALACDIIVAAESATFALPEPKVGLAALAGGLLRLPQQIGTKQAMGIILTGRTVKAEEGLALGFVNEVAPEGELMAVARAWADKMLAVSPMSLRASKAIVQRSQSEPDLKAAYKAQDRYPETRALFRSTDVREGPAAFAEKRKPRWTGK